MDPTPRLREVLSDVHEHRPELDASCVVAEPVTTLNDIMEAMEPLGAVIATRYHNLIAALRLSKPTIAVGYSPKHRALMADMGLGAYCQAVTSLDVELVGQQLLEMEESAEQLRRSLLQRNVEIANLLEKQFAELDKVVIGPTAPVSREPLPFPCVRTRQT